ncbi:alpha/beta hydrolase [Falsiroseomonas bella]|uniref:Alpha/beta hydrolase n=1 Tax=Falsiroseomonas bella TaxID=2184016 RepID=A0A317F8F7_9PROT|nr:alpha/beta fold hydrolase [Falsiroseomonas bella]PWS35035.1 alpha/beta hydrolase [Falsiroseomonas bella]
MHILDDLIAKATRHETPCGGGRMVWHAWNEGAGDPLVLLHGGNGSWRHWVRQIPHFACTRHVIAPDLPGLGESADLPGEQDPLQVARVMLPGLRDLLRGQRADLVGFSFGSNVAGQLAAAMGNELRTLTLVGAAALGVPRNPTPLEKIRDKQGEARIAAHRFNLASLMIADPAKIDDLALAIQEWNTVHARFRSRGFAGTPLLKQALARTTLPLTLIWGELDQVAVGHIHERFAAAQESRPDAVLEVIPGAGHWTAYEAPEELNAALDRALRRAR